MEKMISAIWFFELYPDLMSIRAEDDKNLPKKRPALINRTEVRGYLTKDHCGLIIDPHEDTVAGYYVTAAASMVGLGLLDNASIDEIYNKYGEYMVLLYLRSEADDPECVGVFHPRTWKEEYPDNPTTPTSFRLPAPLLEDYKEACNYYHMSQAKIVSRAMWEHVVGWRYDLLTNTSDILLGNGKAWSPDAAVKYVPIDAGDGC